MTKGQDNTEWKKFDAIDFIEDIMNDETLTPQFFVARGLAIPVLDEEGKENSWQNLLRRIQ